MAASMHVKAKMLGSMQKNTKANYKPPEKPSRYDGSARLRSKSEVRNEQEAEGSARKKRADHSDESSDEESVAYLRKVLPKYAEGYMASSRTCVT